MLSFKTSVRGSSGVFIVVVVVCGGVFVDSSVERGVVGCKASGEFGVRIRLINRAWLVSSFICCNCCKSRR